jgi:hypothetical protein
LTTARLVGRRNGNLFENFLRGLLKIAGDSVLMRKSAVRLEKDRWRAARLPPWRRAGTARSSPSDEPKNGDFVNIINKRLLRVFADRFLREGDLPLSLPRFIFRFFEVHR